MANNTFYVYTHLDPHSEEIRYVGIGQYDRAWCVRRNQRKNSHVKWIESLYEEGYNLNHIVSIVANQLTKKEALQIEMDLIKELKPMFNELSNPNHWNRGRKYTPTIAETAKALHEMGYGYIRIAQLMGGSKNNHMSIKRMIYG